MFESLVPALRPAAEWIFGIIHAADPTARVTSVRRTRAEQARLYARWLRGESRFPAAPPGTSDHELGLAFDIVAKSSVLADAGRRWEAAGGEWGGRYDDEIHFGVRER